MAALQIPLGAQSKLPPDAARTFSDPAAYAPDLAERLTTSELRDVVPRYTADRQLLLRFHTIPMSRARITAEQGFADGWLKALDRLDFARLSQEGKVDYILLRNRIRLDREQVDVESRLLTALEPFAPFGPEIAALQEARQRTEFVTPEQAVKAVDAADGKDQGYDRGGDVAGAHGVGIERRRCRRLRRRPARSAERVVRVLQRLRPGLHDPAPWALQSAQQCARRVQSR